MLKVTPITDIAYLVESANDAPTAVAYYTDAKSEPPAVWWCPGNWIAKDGARASALAVTRLSQGRHPKTGRQIVAGQGNKKRAAIDLTFSAPKAWTALWVVSDQQGRALMHKMLMASVRESLDEVLTTGLIEARIGKGGAKRMSMKALVAALYPHTTSREGDPQAHVHAALLNVGMRQDGQIRAINNNKKLCEVHKMIGAAFRLRLAEKLEAHGVCVKADLEHGFLIDGQPKELADVFSKRRKQIVKAASEVGLAGTAGKLKQVDRIVKKPVAKNQICPAGRRWRRNGLRRRWGEDGCRRRNGAVLIRTIRRQKIAWQRDASMAAQQGEIGEALAAYASHGAVNIADDQTASLAAMATAFREAKGHAVEIAATNAQVGAINEELRQAARDRRHQRPGNCHPRSAARAER